MRAPLDAAGALRLHHESFVFDGHNDLAGPLLRGESFEDREGRGHLDLRRMRSGGLDGGVFAVFVDPDPSLGDPGPRTREGVRRLRETLEKRPDVRLVLTADDAERCARDAEDARESRQNPIAVVIGVEGGYGIDGRDDVDRLYDLGVRCLTLTWNESTEWADAAGRHRHGGLSREGCRIVDRLQDRGILVDVSHAADGTARDVLDRCERPVVASHSGMRRLAPLERNLSDHLLEALARSDGLIGVSFFAGHLDADFEARYAPLRQRSFPDSEAFTRAVRKEAGTLPLARLVEHVEHAVRIVGVPHVGLGSDFDGMWAPPEGLPDAEHLPRLSAAVAEAGVFDADGLRAFLGANWLRVLTRALP